MYTLTLWICWAILIGIGLVSGLIATAPMKWTDRLAFAGASVVAFVTAMVWADYFFPNS